MSSINPIRFTGMASGLDTEQIIKDLMKLEQAPLTKVQQQKQSLIWKREEYREANKQLLSLQNAINSLRFESNFQSRVATSSNSSVVDVKVTSSASEGSYNLKVHSLATSPSITSSPMVNPDSSKIDMKAAVNVANYTIKVKGPTGEYVEVNVKSGSTTRESIISEINAKSAVTGVKANFDSVTNRVFFTSTKTGKESSIEISDSNNLFNLDNSLKDLSAGVYKKTGTNAVFDLNDAVGLESNTNNFSLNGVTFTFKSAQSPTDSMIGVSVGKSTDAAVQKIKEFVSKYNEIIDTFMGKINAKPDRNYSPLTAEQKEAMSEKQIELWESKAKVGLLSGDDMLSETLSTLRKTLNKQVKNIGEFDSLSDIGISVISDWREFGKLTIDEVKLQESLATNPDSVIKLFASVPSDSTKKEELGIAEQLYSDLKNQISRFTKKAGSATYGSSEAIDSSLMGAQMKEYNTKIDSLTEKIRTVENRYYKQFTAMEKAIQEMNSRGSWLSQQLGQG